MPFLKKIIFIIMICTLVLTNNNGAIGTETNKEEPDLNNLLKEMLKALETQLNLNDHANRRLFRRNITMKTLAPTTHSKKYYWQQQWVETTRSDSSAVETSTMGQSVSDDDSQREIKQLSKFGRSKSWFDSKNISKNKNISGHELEQILSQIKYKELLVKTNDEFLSYLDKSVEDMENKMKTLDQQIKNGYKELNSSWDIIVQTYNRSKIRRQADVNKPMLISPQKLANLDNNDFSKMVANLLAVKSKNKQVLSTSNNYLPIWPSYTSPQQYTDRKIRAITNKKLENHGKKKKINKLSTTESVITNDQEELAKYEEENSDEDDHSEKGNKGGKMKKNMKTKAEEEDQEEQDEDVDSDDSKGEHENNEETDEEQGNKTESKNFAQLLLKSLKKFIPFSRKNRGSFIESSLPLDITYRLNDELEPKLAHVTICVKNDLTTSGYDN